MPVAIVLLLLSWHTLLLAWEATLHLAWHSLLLAWEATLRLTWHSLLLAREATLCLAWHLTHHVHHPLHLLILHSHHLLGGDEAWVVGTIVVLTWEWVH